MHPIISGDLALDRVRSRRLEASALAEFRLRQIQNERELGIAARHLDDTARGERSQPKTGRRFVVLGAATVVLVVLAVLGFIAVQPAGVSVSVGHGPVLGAAERLSSAWTMLLVWPS